MTAWLHVDRLIRSITWRTWDDSAWPEVKATLRRALEIRGELARRAWWN
jgi:hypothetical protein